MSFRSTRFRLTAWYLAILVVGLSVFGIGSWYAMRVSVFHTIDEELEDRIRGVAAFMQLRIASLSPAEIHNEFREHSLGPGGDLFQVCDANGAWLYRSAVLEGNQIPIRLPEHLGTEPVYESLAVQNTAVRFATALVVVNGRPYSIQVAAPLSEFNDVLKRFGLILWFSAPLLLVGAAFGGYFISRRALRPVDQITGAAESISINNLSDRLAVPKTSDELQRLSETLNRMLARLDTSVKKMTQLTADASHELRGPVSLIRTTAELAVRGGRTNSDFHNDMVQILTEAERTTRLIDSLLILARADSKEGGLQLELTQLAVSVREAIRQAKNLAAEKRIELTASLVSEPIIVHGDSEALRRLFFILIDNALKYTPEGGRVQVSLISSEGNAVVTVQDSGIGIAEADQPYIFDRFWRADPVRSRGTGGAGLGLSIAHWIVKEHKGSIAVQSRPGQGSTFKVAMPMAGVIGDGAPTASSISVPPR